MGQWPFCDKKHKKPTEVRCRTSPGGGKGEYFLNPKDCDSDTPARASENYVDLQHDWPVTQGHSDTVLQVSLLLAGSFLKQELLVPGCTVHKALPGQRSLWAIATQTVCNNDNYFWNTVKTNIGARELSTSSVRKVYATTSLSESEQEQCPD